MLFITIKSNNKKIIMFFYFLFIICITSIISFNFTHKIYAYIKDSMGISIIDEQYINEEINIIEKDNMKTYGKSVKGEELKYYEIGTGENVLITVFAQHGYEDAWDKDGKELVKIANNFIEELKDYEDDSIFDKWTIYIIPCANPDGIKYGVSGNGVGRTNYDGIDMNRSYDTSNFKIYKEDRYFNGNRPFLAKEAKALKTLMESIKVEKNGKMVVLDVHGWYDQTVGDIQIGKYYNEEFNNINSYSYGSGYLITWAKETLKAKVSLVELPLPKSPKDIINKDFSGKFINATFNLLHNE